MEPKHGMCMCAIIIDIGEAMWPVSIWLTATVVSMSGEINENKKQQQQIMQTNSQLRHTQRTILQGIILHGLSGRPVVQRSCWQTCLYLGGYAHVPITHSHKCDIKYTKWQYHHHQLGQHNRWKKKTKAKRCYMLLMIIAMAIGVELHRWSHTTRTRITPQAHWMTNMADICLLLSASYVMCDRHKWRCALASMSHRIGVALYCRC